MDISEPFIQTEDSIYWLEISFIDLPFVGWKQTDQNWNDDAVWYDGASAMPWVELHDPTGISIDLAFVINGEPQEIGACCYNDPPDQLDRYCIETTEDSCYTFYNGTWEGPGTTCGGVQACCIPGWGCEMADSICCEIELGGIPAGPGTTCTGTMVACCFQDGTCQDLDSTCCEVMGGWISPYSTMCLGDGNSNGTDDACEDEVDQACCFPDGTCADMLSSVCISSGGTPQGPGTFCDPTGATVACCLPGGGCADVDPLCCDEMGGYVSPFSAVCLGDGNGNTIDDACESELELKWEQTPDLNPTGMDVNCTWLPPNSQFLLADDFLCTFTGPIYQISVYGSWWQDHLPVGSPYSVWFTLSIHEDIPATENPFGEYSMPGEVLWVDTFYQFIAEPEAMGLEEGWFEPPDWYDVFGDSVCWKYTFNLDEPFIQMGTPDSSIVYWLDVQAHPMEDQAAYFGWKTSLDHWNDDATWIMGEEPVPAGAQWNELIYVPPHPWAGISIDLAFEIWVENWTVLRDTVVCEPQGGGNPTHPPTFWYDVTPANGTARYDFHVLVHDSVITNYSNWVEPAGWLHVLQKVGGNWWVSWCNPLLDAPITSTTRFSFDNIGLPVWGDWRTTIDGFCNPYTGLIDSAGNHTGDPNGFGFFVHVPMAEEVPDSGACCLADTSCIKTTETDCNTYPNSEYKGDGTNCLGDSNGDGYDDICYMPVEDTCDYYKPAYEDYSPAGMPDFDQKQAGWIGPPYGHWTHCGPVAVANCLWWFDSKFEPAPVDPRPFYPGPGNPGPNDGFPLVWQYNQNWDDHDTNNVVPFVNDLAGYLQTNMTVPGTFIWDIDPGIDNYLTAHGLHPDYFYHTTVMGPPYELIRDETLRSQDVILLLSFYEQTGADEWCRIGGHYVTTAGVCLEEFKLCISDPFFDKNEGEPPAGSAHGPTVHNDAFNVSGPHGGMHHDAYPVAIMMPPISTSPAVCELPTYFHPDILNFLGQNDWDPYCTYSGGATIRTLIDFAVVICPCELLIGDANNDLSINVSDAVYIINYAFGGGSAPMPYAIASGDANCDCGVNVSDAVYIINYAFSGGPPPCTCIEWLNACGTPLR